MHVICRNFYPCVTSVSKIDTKEILNTKLFNFEDAQNSAGWQKELEGGEHTPETEEYGISSFVFRSQKPFHPQRFWNYLSKSLSKWNYVSERIILVSFKTQRSNKF